MISIKKIGILVSISILFLAPLRAETRNSGFSISPIVGFLYGHAEEIVYKFPNRDLYFSELLWDLKPLVLIGATVDYGPGDRFQYSGFISSLSLRYGLPFRTGIIENRDWLDLSHNNVTHYSRHDAFSRGVFLGDISAGYSWRLSDSLTLGAFLEFSYKRFSWSGRDGFIQYPLYNPFGNYPPWNSDLPRHYDLFSGEVIRYTQNWFILSPGFSLMWKPLPLFTVAGNINYSPLIYCYARDLHVLRNITFHDYLSFGHYLKGSFDVLYSLAENMDLSFMFSYSHITGTRGDAHVGAFRFRQGAGAGYSAFGFEIAARIRLTGRN